ncbi:hypothetical protein AWB78_01362 [Caballeronia calidae]|uniref:Uncharacterized protein n=1 Tax=Caballeronia calidae TaxID=1777139 RepID=A0A158A7X9_9BURK|nr:hypothetical protein [Caballeronia calidae]SAK53805.1 hypothetical protein AWB78_01362 [Caballeronia calidae]
MSRRPFVVQVQEGHPVDTLTLCLIVDRMSIGQYARVGKLFGAEIGPNLEDDEPINLDDMPLFDHGQ